MKKLMLTITTLFLLCLASSSLAALEPPVLSSSTDGLKMTLDWPSVPDATGYRLYYVPVASYSGPESVSSIDLGASTTFNYTLWNGASFYLAVTAYNDQEGSLYSNIEVVTIGAVSVPPTAPELSATTSGLDISLSWTAVPDATGYILNYAPSPYSGPESFTTVDVGTDTSFSATLSDGAAFTVAVQAYNHQGVSDYSNTEGFTIAPAPTETSLATLLAGKTYYTTIDDESLTLESWTFNNDATYVTTTELYHHISHSQSPYPDPHSTELGPSESIRMDVDGMTINLFNDSNGVDTIEVIGALTINGSPAGLTISIAGGPQQRLYRDRATAERYIPVIIE